MPPSKKIIYIKIFSLFSALFYMYAYFFILIYLVEFISLVLLDWLADLHTLRIALSSATPAGLFPSLFLSICLPLLTTTPPYDQLSCHIILIWLLWLQSPRQRPSKLLRFLLFQLTLFLSSFPLFPLSILICLHFSLLPLYGKIARESSTYPV